jgi:hypothetical protein
MRSGLYKRLWTSLPTPFISAQRLSERTVLSNSEGRLCNNGCIGKAIRTTHSEFVSVALGIQHIMRKCHIDDCGLNVCAYFSRISHKIAGFLEKKIVTEYNMRVVFFSPDFVYTMYRVRINYRKIWLRSCRIQTVNVIFGMVL